VSPRVSSLIALTCQACGGAVALKAGQRVPACLFCGSKAIEEAEVPEEVEGPETLIPFQLDDSEAKAAFRVFASSSIWYPGDLRRANLELHRILLPAWTWSAQIETHWAALVSAASRSGKKPRTGRDTDRVDGVLVESSSAVSRAELSGIAPYSGEAERPFDPDQVDDPYELGRLTRSAATSAARTRIKEMHRAQLQSRHGASKLNAASLVRELVGKPLLLPIYIGAYRRKETLYRVVINGQTGRLHGKAPLSWLRIGAAVALGLGFVAFILLVVGLFVGLR
jgi:hypothetical protein